MALGQQAITSRSFVHAVSRLVALALALGAFSIPASAQQFAALSPDLLSSYIANQSAATLSRDDVTFQPEKWLDEADREKRALDKDVLSAYAATGYVPTKERVAAAREERGCLAQAIYHEARGEPEKGQWAVANVVLNRVASVRYPGTICGVVFQNAGGARFRCQFTFACDGRPDSGGSGNRIVREAWVRANVIALAAFKRYQKGDRLDTLPRTTLFYHTTDVRPSWSSAYRAVAEIGRHIFYSPS